MSQSLSPYYDMHIYLRPQICSSTSGENETCMLVVIVALTGADFVPTGSTWQCLEASLVVITRGVCDCHLVECKPGTLLNILWDRSPPTPQLSSPSEKMSQMLSVHLVHECTKPWSGANVNVLLRWRRCVPGTSVGCAGDGP